MTIYAKSRIKALKDRNLSIIEFNSRVLDMVDTNIPDMEKMNFIKIVCNNILEFLTVRFARITNKTLRDYYMQEINSLYMRIEEMLDNIPFDTEYIYDKNDLIYQVILDIDNQFHMFKCDDPPLISDIVRSNKIKERFYVRFIPNMSTTFTYSGEGVDTILNELTLISELNNENSNNIKSKSYIQIQTTCTIDYVNSKFLEYLEKHCDIIYVDERIMQINELYNFLEKTYVDNGLYFEKFESFYSKKDYYKNMNSRVYNNLIHCPYDSYVDVLDFIDQMCSNPNISGIFITLYRLGKNSPIIESLINASKMGKSVYVYIEATARGDEVRNIEYIKRLKDEGINVECRYYNYKIHAKLFLAIDNNGQMFGHIGTGNYNPLTSKMYTDIHLITSDPNMTSNIFKIFQTIFHNKPPMNMKTLNESIIVSPINMRDVILNKINDEIIKGDKGRIYIKCNALSDKIIMKEINKASMMGVDVRLLIRTAIRLEDDYELDIRSKVGRFLEHERIYIFGNEVYISSADLLERNMDRRIEIMANISSTQYKDFIIDLFNNKFNSKMIFKLDYKKGFQWKKMS